MIYKWDKFFLDQAIHIATMSKDPSSKFGAVITQGKFQVGQGYNGFPQGIPDDFSMLENRETKLAMVIHAEENAILNTERRNLHGATLYVGGPPCARCAAKIAQVGIKRVVYYEGSDEFNERWAKDINLAQYIFDHAGIEITIYSK